MILCDYCKPRQKGEIIEIFSNNEFLCPECMEKVFDLGEEEEIEEYEYCFSCGERTFKSDLKELARRDFCSSCFNEQVNIINPCYVCNENSTLKDGVIYKMSTGIDSFTDMETYYYAFICSICDMKDSWD